VALHGLWQHQAEGLIMRYHQGALVRQRRAIPIVAVLTGLIAVDTVTKEWCYKEHVDGKQVTICKSVGWQDYMENFNPVWRPVDADWRAQIAAFFPNIEIHSEHRYV
jgi:hypothetical protein